MNWIYSLTKHFADEQGVTDGTDRHRNADTKDSGSVTHGVFHRKPQTEGQNSSCNGTNIIILT